MFTMTQPIGLIPKGCKRDPHQEATEDHNQSPYHATYHYHHQTQCLQIQLIRRKERQVQEIQVRESPVNGCGRNFVTIRRILRNPVVSARRVSTRIGSEYTYVQMSQ